MLKDSLLLIVSLLFVISMLAMLSERLGHDPACELQIAAGEQKKITELRLQKLIGI